MSGGPKGAKRPLERPLDGGVRRRTHRPLRGETEPLTVRGENVQSTSRVVEQVTDPFAADVEEIEAATSIGGDIATPLSA